MNESIEYDLGSVEKMKRKLINNNHEYECIYSCFSLFSIIIFQMSFSVKESFYYSIELFCSIIGSIFYITMLFIFHILYLFSRIHTPINIISISSSLLPNT